MLIHIVRPGDTLYKIGQRYGVSAERLITDNAISNPERLMVGQAIVVPVTSVRHTVLAGESLYSIAQMYSVTVDAIAAANPQITNPAQIFAGQVITIPLSDEKIGSIYVNGYVFPGISTDTLQKTLPNLTFISIFSYEVRADGSLSNLNDRPIIDAARAANVAPLMVITNIREGGGFSGDIAHAVLTNEAAQNNLINNILQTLPKGYYGINVDFEYIFPYDRESYNQFIARLTETLKAQGYIVTTSLAPKISADQQGTLYEAHDYPFHGRTVDFVILMTYEWGYTYGPAQAVAPLNEVRRVLDYAVTAIPPEKILMGIPNYGYDWTLPFVQGSSARVLSNTAAANLASSVGAEIKFDLKAQSPFFNYFDNNGNEHVVWFEDARSIRAKLYTVNEYGLAGVSYWTLNSYFPQNWIVLNSMYNVIKVL
ncbi:MAG: LysM peptidoglycan-binding domain-containing protein [Clostridiales bacterium]|nr:LysM peptidoglycan-binding domain-containing protein [Clostridiales bacterium]